MNQGDASKFCMICCQQGAEGAVKAEVSRAGWNLAFSRPGFVTFKHRGGGSGGEEPALPSGTFCRSVCWSLGKTNTDQSDEVVDALVQAVESSGVTVPFDLLHLWSRDRLPVGERGFMPGPEPLTDAVAQSLNDSLVAKGIVRASGANQVARTDDRILDVVIGDPGHWWFGWHEAQSAASRWPGGAFPISRDREVISRAYFKTSEAIAWSGFPIEDGDRFVEIGSAPGGSVQRLLEMGMNVTGIDPADMDESILDHPKFSHIRARGGDIPRRAYSGAKWLLVDSNVRPEKTMTTVQNIVQNRNTDFEGLLLTLKLSDYERHQDIPDWLATIRCWGFAHVRSRQLASGKKEICVAASKVVP